MVLFCANTFVCIKQSNFRTMKNTQHLNLTLILFIAAALTTLMSSCNKNTMSTLIEDKSLGQNGSFEHSKDGIPYNWQLYTMQTVPSGNFDILPDPSNPKQGNQSLMFKVRECDSTGGWRSPGIAQQKSANPGETYLIGFWIKNQGSTYRAKISGIAATTGESELIVETGESNNDWKYYEYTYTIPKKMNAIRFEFNVLTPGTVWIDDVKIGIISEIP